MRILRIAVIFVLATCSTAAPYADPPPTILPPLPRPGALGVAPAPAPPPPVALVPPRPAPAHPRAPTRRGVAVGLLTDVFEEPRIGARIVGWIQTGRVVDLGPRSDADAERCPQGWYPLADGRGFVCAGRDVILGRADRRTKRGTAGARLDELVPYRYALVHADPGTLRYSRRPTPEEREAREALGASAVDGDLVPRFMKRGFMMSVRGLAGHGPNTFWSCVRGGYVRYEHAYTLRPRSFAGVDLRASGERLPIAFVTSHTAKVPRLSHFDASRPATVGGVPMLTRPEGAVVRAADVAVVRLPPLPPDLPPGEKWIDVSLADQTLVAMEGDRPVFATVVSTGLRIPSRRTPAGTFRVQAKHVSATMDRHAAGTEYSIEDVPWTMFYDASFALHGAFWHDDFGRPKSHGCVNLSAHDAKWLFQWASPTLPPGWYGILATDADPGTRIVIR